MGKIFTTGEIDYNPATVFFTSVSLSMVVFTIIGYQFAKWAFVDDYTFSFTAVFFAIISMVMLIYYGIKFVKMSG